MNEVSIRNKELAMVCPRRAFVQSEIPGGVQKHRDLTKIFMNVVNVLPLTAGRAEIEAQVNTEFSMANLNLIEFEQAAEKKKMIDLLYRYYIWEQDQLKNDVVAKNFKVVVPFDGEDTEVRVHRLFDRGDYYEAVVYAYKRPDLTTRGRKFTSMPKNSIRLLLLNRACEKKLEQLRQIHGEAAYPLKMVYGSVFYMRSSGDNKEFLPYNDRGDQIVSWSFSPSEANNLEIAYKKVAVNSKDEACNPSDCNNCPCIDLCKTEFVPKEKVVIPPPEIKPINEIKLTKAQEEFVSFTSGECRVNAVAGSGKTTIIVLRTANLIELGVEPEEIMMVTFTDKACGEMRERLQRYLEGDALSNLKIDANRVVIETFNSWGQKLLAANYDKVGFTSVPQVIDDIVRKDIIIELLKVHNKLPLNYNEPFMDTMMACGAVVEMGHVLDTMKAAHVENEQDIHNLKKLPAGMMRCAPELLQIYQEYNDLLRQKNLIDYEDQIRLIQNLAAQGVLKSLPYRHIVVDEFQDSNKNQIDLICSLMRECPNVESLAVVGDEMQAIYGFRDASPENLIDFDKYFPNMKDFFLEDNFRSQAPIITMANNLLVKEARIKKAIKARRDSSQVTPLLLNKNDPQDEIAFYVDVIKKWTEDDGLAPSSIAILGHTRAELRAYERALSAAGIPCIVRVPEILRDCAYVKGILAFAKWLNDPSQMVSFALYAKMLGQDPFDLNALKKSSDYIRAVFDNAATDADKIGLFYTMLDEARKDYLGAFFLEELQNKSHIHTFASLIDYCVKYDKYNINEPHSTAKEAAEAVSLITIHSAKGLEYDNVLLSLKRFKETDEEKRLLYVAVTRARERLIVTYPQKSSLYRLLKD